MIEIMGDFLRNRAGRASHRANSSVVSAIRRPSTIAENDR
jgi:hypothetical protein